MAKRLSLIAAAICRQHWQPKGAACGACPIHTPCTTFPGTLSATALADWRSAVNQAAEKVAAANPISQR